MYQLCHKINKCIMLGLNGSVRWRSSVTLVSHVGDDESHVGDGGTIDVGPCESVGGTIGSVARGA